MNDRGTAAPASGIGICGLLGVAFIILKLTDAIDWSWWWATAPFWGPTAIALAVVVIGFLLWCAARLIQMIRRNTKARKIQRQK